MKNEFSFGLKNLAKLFSRESTLYAVGGFVRNGILGIENTDIDLCGDLSIEKVLLLLDDTDYIVKIKSAKMGTVEIFYENEKYEYTAFRKDSYTNSQSHEPSNVLFGVSIQEDASRRDFTINAIYKNILTGEILDFYDGVNDCKKKIIKCVETPEYVFSSDGDRILRLIRLKCELDFEIDQNTFEQAKLNIKNLKSICGARKRKELEKILYCDRKYANNDFNRVILGINTLKEVGANKYLIKGLNNEFDAKNLVYLNNKNNKNRLNAYLIDVFNYLNVGTDDDRIKYVNSLRETLSLSNIECKNILTLLVMFEKSKRFYDDNQIKLFIAKYNANILSFLELIKYADNEKYNKIQKNYSNLLKQKAPLKLSDLKISGKEVMKYCINKNDISKVLDKLLYECIIKPSINNKTDLINRVIVLSKTTNEN